MKVLYHANCHDGAGAALAAWMELGDETSTGEAIDYIPVQYGNTPPDVTNEEVFILDFSYPRMDIIDMAMQANRITIIDHHKTAQADLSEPFPRQFDTEPLCDVQCIFDMQKSGAVLAWEYFHPDEPLPPLLASIQDRDLWRFDMLATKPISKGLTLYPDWRDWREFVSNSELLSDVALEGTAIDRFLHIQSDKITDNEPVQWDIEPDIVPVYNLPGFMLSDTLHMALEKYPDSPYAVGFFDLPDRRVYSLRSRSRSDVDVSEIAQRHGGGGHKHAAGFVVNRVIEK